MIGTTSVLQVPVQLVCFFSFASVLIHIFVIGVLLQFEGVVKKTKTHSSHILTATFNNKHKEQKKKPFRQINCMYHIYTNISDTQQHWLIF